MSRIRIRGLERVDYLDSLESMRAFTRGRGPETPDEIWLVEHPPVFTQGLSGKADHLHDPGSIPVVATERGGQVTYHGPGQAVAYLLIDLHRRGLTVRDLVRRIEQSVIECLAANRIAAMRKPGAPGVYLRSADGSAGAKIASLGLKVSRGCTFHGVALNVAMDLEPFSRIDPCGFPGLAVTDMRSVVGEAELAAVAAQLGALLAGRIETD